MSEEHQNETYESTRTANEHFEAIARSVGYSGQDPITTDGSVAGSNNFDSNNSIFGCSSMCLTAKESDEKQIEMIVQQKKCLKPSKSKYNRTLFASKLPFPRHMLTPKTVHSDGTQLYWTADAVRTSSQPLRGHCLYGQTASASGDSKQY